MIYHDICKEIIDFTARTGCVPDNLYLGKKQAMELQVFTAGLTMFNFKPEDECTHSIFNDLVIYTVSAEDHLACSI